MDEEWQSRKLARPNRDRFGPLSANPVSQPLSETGQFPSRTTRQVGSLAVADPSSTPALHGRRGEPKGPWSATPILNEWMENAGTTRKPNPHSPRLRGAVC